MNILHLKYAVEVEKTRSINRAAENLFMAQPNLSRAIRELEESLGITIFHRTSKGISVTPQGEEFLQYAKKILSQIDEVEALYKNARTGKQSFSISVPRASYISAAFTEFSKKIDAEEDLLDQMNEEITSFLIKVASLENATGQIQNKLNQLLQITDNLENVSDEITSIIYNIDKFVGKKNDKPEEKVGYDKLLPYTEKLLEFFTFAEKHISTGVSENEKQIAFSMEEEIDAIEKILKKDSRKRLENGQNVKSELKYMDIVRRIENAGDAIFSIIRIL